MMPQLLILAANTTWYNQPTIRWPIMVAYLSMLALITLYGTHRYWLVWRFCRHGVHPQPPPKHFDTLPTITVQLPMFNEANVAARVIDATCQLHYPKDRLQVQVLDDSTDSCAEIAQQRCGYWANRGINIEFQHRENRKGFKAGALGEALRSATGRFIAVFDADFVPPPQFLKQTIHYLADPSIGMVQTRWDHLNRTDSILTRMQAIFLDGHFVVEHTARNRSSCWINFNGTAGLWRREAIETAGGWQHDTLTEDVDLSYRSQLAGWKFVYLPNVTCPAELPPEINAFKAQQHRWTKGSIQTARKLLPTLLRASPRTVPRRIKVEAFFHLTCPMVYLFMTLMALLFLPTIYVNAQPFEQGTPMAIVLTVFSFALGTLSVGVFYTMSQRAQGRSALATIMQIPMLMALGIGISVNNTRAIIEALIGFESPFIRTPKYNSDRQSVQRQSMIPMTSIKLWMPFLEIALGIYTLISAWLVLSIHNAVVGFPFLLLFAGGFLYVGLTSLRLQLQLMRSATRNKRIPITSVQPHRYPEDSGHA